MSVGSGLAGSLGYAVESTYGTYVAPAKWQAVNAAPIKKVKNIVQGGGLAAGRLVDPVAYRVVNSQAAAGSLDLEVPSKGFGLLLAHVFGGVVAPVQQAATPAYLQTHPLIDNYGRSLTMQVGVPDQAGTVRPYTFLGAKILEAEFSAGVDQLLMCTLTLDARDVSESQGLVAPSYVTGVVPFSFRGMAVKIGAFGAEAAVTGVKKVTAKISRPAYVDGYYANGAGLKAEPITNGKVQVTGTIETDFVDKTTFADRFAADSSFSLVWDMVGANISGIYNTQFGLTLPACVLDTDTPTLDGPDVVSPSFNFQALYDGTNPAVTGRYTSTDTTLL